MHTALLLLAQVIASATPALLDEEDDATHPYSPHAVDSLPSLSAKQLIEAKKVELDSQLERAESSRGW